MSQGSRPRLSLFLVLSLAGLTIQPEDASPAGGRGAAPVIEHLPVAAWPNHAHPQLMARIHSEAAIASVKLYFRAQGSREFHFVVMSPVSREGLYEAVLPIPKVETGEVDYFIEAINESFDISWTETFQAETTSGPTATGVSPGSAQIWIGKLTADSPNGPPGFEMTGVAGLLANPGVRVTYATDEEEESHPVAPGPLAGEGTSTSFQTGDGSWGTIAAVGIAATAGAGAAVLAAQEGRSPDRGRTITPLEACFTVNPDPPRIPAGGKIELNAGCSSSADVISSFQWELGDGRFMEGPSVNPTYEVAGDYNVVLRVGDGTGFAVSRRRIQVLPTSGSTSIAACITTDPFDGVVGVGENLRLDGNCSQPSESISSFQWDLGDGRVRNGRVVNVSYPSPGSYTVALTISNGMEFNVARTAVTVEGASVLSACFSRIPASLDVRNGEEIVFDASCSTPIANISSFSWDLGDGQQKEGRAVKKTYNVDPQALPANFTVTLTVSDGISSASASESVRITGSTSGPDSTADLKIEIGTAFLTPTVGSAELYRVKVTNDGPNEVFGYRVTWTFAGAGTPKLESSDVECQGSSQLGQLTVDCDYTTSLKAGDENEVAVNVSFPSEGHYTLDASVANADTSVMDPGAGPNIASTDIDVSSGGETVDLEITNVVVGTTTVDHDGRVTELTATIRNKLPGSPVDAKLDWIFSDGELESSFGCSPSGSNVNCTIMSLTTTPMMVSVRMRFASPDNHQLLTSIRSDGNTDTDQSNNVFPQGNTTLNFSFDPMADLHLTSLSVPATPPKVGEDAEYTAAFQNEGPDSTMAELVWTFTPDANVQSVGAGCFPTMGSQATVTCDLGSLDKGEGGSRKVTVKFPAETPMQKVQVQIQSTSMHGDPGPEANSADTTFSVTTLQVLPLRTSFNSILEVEGPDPVRGRVIVNEARTDGTEARVPFRHAVEGRVGENRVQAVRLTSGPEGFWRFDFADSPRFDVGSLMIRMGQVVARGATFVTFRLNGSPGETIEFSYRLKP